MEHEIFNSDDEENVSEKKKGKKLNFDLFSFENIPYALIFVSIFFTMIARIVAIASGVAAVVISFLAFGVAFSAFILAVISMLKKKKFEIKDGVCLFVTTFGMLIAVL